MNIRQDLGKGIWFPPGFGMRYTKEFSKTKIKKKSSKEVISWINRTSPAKWNLGKLKMIQIIDNNWIFLLKATSQEKFAYN